MKRPGLSIYENAIEALSQYDWPGNVRKLANVIERAVVLASGDIHRFSAGRGRHEGIVNLSGIILISSIW
jgi:DNA-binding NtrC family response regulator